MIVMLMPYNEMAFCLILVHACETRIFVTLMNLKAKLLKFSISFLFTFFQMKSFFRTRYIRTNPVPLNLKDLGLTDKYIL